jgi:hypothetical protein
MDSGTVRAAIFGVIAEIQSISGLECPEITGDTRPATAVPRFDSKIWAVAATLLGEKINVDIPEDVNLFFDESTNTPRTIDQTVAIVCAIAANKKTASAHDEL